MTRIANAFKDKKAFIGFLTAGDPSIDKTAEYILAMDEGGCDLIEIGIPFSDPVAEGPVIQEANIRALKHNVSVEDVFNVVREVRKKTDIPLVFLTYINPVLHYGYEKFFLKCEELGVDGVITPDIPFEEKGEIDGYAKKYNIDIVSLIAPTSNERIHKIAKAASGFIYVVSSLGVTGVRPEITTDLETIISEIRKVTDVPTAVGFGISTPKQASEIAKITDGVIVGSAIVKIIEKYGDDASEHLIEYVKSMKNACK
ncbi:tryptophan synthase subunit alpha [Methanobrevibacter sp. DSM 116169]|uniref:tryptophan synthase subunit alpha n=1 Tax=Methanobrevibacter sp. DSM 116169 TaxID=3242727 RepID=UPI0038FD1D74